MATYANPPGTVSQRLNEIRTELGTQDTSDKKDVQRTLQNLMTSVHKIIDVLEELSEKIDRSSDK